MGAYLKSGTDSGPRLTIKTKRIHYRKRFQFKCFIKCNVSSRTALDTSRDDDNKSGIFLTIWHVNQYLDVIIAICEPKVTNRTGIEQLTEPNPTGQNHMKNPLKSASAKEEESPRGPRKRNYEVGVQKHEAITALGDLLLCGGRPRSGYGPAAAPAAVVGPATVLVKVIFTYLEIIRIFLNDTLFINDTAFILFR
ncbi:hypothetical protein ABEB36_007316 [Hypothenemus hampei]|uniref:Uncharacterized protein n=1 Tax=Hypothenemus hampei TaxID=57062 RepID=A0ABD1EWN7_HYPHA